MSEDQSFLERAFRRAQSEWYTRQGLHPGSHHEWSRDIRSERIAKQQVIEFIKTSSQEPRATFTANSASVFDLSQYESGTILRVQYEVPIDRALLNPESHYHWYVLGQKRADKKIYVYDIWYSEMISIGEKLRSDLADKLYVFSPNPIRISSFPVKAADLFFRDRIENVEEGKDEIEKFPTVKVDVMAMGKPNRATEKDRSAISNKREFVREIA